MAESHTDARQKCVRDMLRAAAHYGQVPTEVVVWGHTWVYWTDRMDDGRTRYEAYAMTHDDVIVWNGRVVVHSMSGELGDAMDERLALEIGMHSALVRLYGDCVYVR